ncbi:hypothetical protein Ga0100231_012365 [Opitutaceae bacterium TAV4]|uniref:hypothetical protein n=1 Tax=Geminisphaera colitermitum TaxID=1148786 RepID=UPI000158D478|nr:hypothetical protein [Geminisphaera colitermitum]RRJ94995.1 hypothetical protein Ga0100231_012365 [Opitutaceae bacterium TAV4]RRJ98879.1 hypothetical protein Ga0100230_011270 [Opitutaceae bacterium TAV3]
MKNHIEKPSHPRAYLRSLAFVFAFITAAATTPADTLATWDFNGGTELDLATALKSHSAVTGIVAYDAALNNASTSAGITDQQALKAAPKSSLSSFNFSNAFTNASYVSVTIAVQEGYQLSLDSFTFKAASGAGSGTGGVRAFYLLSSVTGFVNDTAKILEQDWAGVNGTVTGTLPAQGSSGTTRRDYSVTLTDPAFNNAFQNIASGTEIEFRLYYQTNGTNITVIFDDVKFNGTVTAVPEPAAISLFAGLGVAALGLVVRHRRKNRA